LTIATGQALEFYLDSKARISLAIRELVKEFFPKVQILEGLHAVSLIGIGTGLTIQNFVHLTFDLTSVDRDTFRFEAEVYLVDKLVYSILLSNSFLKKNRINIQYAKHVKDFDSLE
jgi:hypothetical protein